MELGDPMNDIAVPISLLNPPAAGQFIRLYAKSVCSGARICGGCPRVISGNKTHCLACKEKIDAQKTDRERLD